MSFFSGHALIGVYASTFLIFYFHYRMRRFRFFKFLIQTILILVGYLIGVSRVFDHRHFVADVVTGGGVGILFATHVWLFQLDKFNTRGNVENRTENFPLN